MKKNHCLLAIPYLILVLISCKNDDYIKKLMKLSFLLQPMTCS